jgi:hypothetical protein
MDIQISSSPWTSPVDANMPSDRMSSTDLRQKRWPRSRGGLPIAPPHGLLVFSSFSSFQDVLASSQAFPVIQAQHQAGGRRPRLLPLVRCSKDERSVQIFQDEFDAEECGQALMVTVAVMHHASAGSTARSFGSPQPEDYGLSPRFSPTPGNPLEQRCSLPRRYSPSAGHEYVTIGQVSGAFCIHYP